jgi:23S rRNA (uracil1939-C5)-methyltransferase
VLRVVPDQGRAHQVRRHMAAIGHPVLGDDRYGHGPANRYFEEKMALDRSFLHGVRLEITHPDTGLRHVFDAPLPGDLRAVLERMSGPDTLRFLDHKEALGRRSSMPPELSELSSDAGGEAPLDVDATSATVVPPAIGRDDGDPWGAPEPSSDERRGP